LIDNAIKFSDDGGQIAVQVRHSSADGTAVFSVRDHGSGIAAEDLPHIFERFYLGDKARLRDKKGRGSGLGLPICQSIVAAHGGQIHVASTVGVGTVVTVSLMSTRAAGTHDSSVANAPAHQDQRATLPIVTG
jgi:two-component system sensor histidine kinase BaeS